MAKTLLNCVNEIFKPLGLIAGDSGALTSLTDSARQHWIDTAVQIVNEGIDHLYTRAKEPMPTEQAEDRIVLQTDIRDYSLPDDLVTLHFPLIDKTNTRFIHRHKGGYNALLRDDPEQDDTGTPLLAAISPITSELRLDRAPTSSDNENIYTFQYHRDLELTVATSKVPFNDTVFRAMVPAWAELWKRKKRNTFDSALFDANLGRAAGLLSQVEERDSWSPR